MSRMRCDPAVDGKGVCGMRREVSAYETEQDGGSERLGSRGSETAHSSETAERPWGIKRVAPQ